MLIQRASSDGAAHRTSRPRPRDGGAVATSDSSAGGAARSRSWRSRARPGRRTHRPSELSSESNDTTRVCILLAKSMDPAVHDEALAGLVPRPEYLVLREALGADLYDFHDVAASSGRLVALARRLGPKFGLAALGFSVRKRYDHFYCTGEDIALPFGILMVVGADFGRVTALVHNINTTKRRTLMRLIPSRVWRYVICISDEQRRLLTEACRLPADLVHRLPYWVDTRFYDPTRAADRSSEFDVLSCGWESRDYDTLATAADGSDLTYHVIASGWHPGVGVGVSGATTPDVHNVEVEGSALSYVQLRDRYHAARVVAVPLQQVDYAAGVTSVLEAMSMGKPVVASSSSGIVEYIDDGESGVLTPVGDGGALRSAVEALVHDGGRAAAMGARNRAAAEQHYAVELHAERMAALYGTEVRQGPLLRAR